MVLSSMGTLSDRKIVDALAWHVEDNRYKVLLRHRIQRRRGGDQVQRSYSCEDLSALLYDKDENDKRDDGLSRGSGIFKRTSSSSDRNRAKSSSSRPGSPTKNDDSIDDTTLKSSVEKSIKADTHKAHRTQRNTKSKRDKKNKIKGRTKTVSFPANSLLHYAVLENDLDMVNRLLQGDAVSMDVLSKEGTAPLHEAAISGNVECVDLLLKHGANVDVLDAEGYTPLEYATYAGQFDCASLLISLGANVSRIKDGCSLQLTR